MGNFNQRQSRGYGSSANRSNRSHGQRRKYGSGRSGGYNRYRSRGPSLNPMVFVKKAIDVVEKPYEPVNTFYDFPFTEAIKRNISKHGFEKPTAIQDQAILPILQGKDLVGIANTGTGKTAAFLLPLITKVSRDQNQRALIVLPTRELAGQVQDELRLFSSGSGIFSTLCIGGASLNNQARNLSRRPNFVIGTPGRIKDLEKRRSLDLKHFNNVVLDEVDRMLDMGFIRDIQHIISILPTNRQSLFFSATIPEKTKPVMRQFLRNPVTISVKTGTTAQNVDQDIVRIQGRNKIEVLYQILTKEEFKKVLVFGRTKHGVNRLETALLKWGLKVTSIHGNKSQGQRQRALRQFKTDQVNVLLATDVASRGIDVEDITHVINFDAPENYDDYVHRIGRTGRAGKKGVALTFVN